jgi:hypothetical protein
VRAILRTLLLAFGASLVVLASPAEVVATTWTPIQQLAPAGRVPGAASLAITSGATHAVYTRRGVVYRRSTDGGRTWAPERRLARNSLDNSLTVGALAIAARNRTVVALYSVTDRPNEMRTLRVRQSLDEGLTWSSSTAIASYGVPGLAGRTDGTIALSAAGIFVGWTDPASGEIRVRSSLDGGGTYSPAVVVGTTVNRSIQNQPFPLNGNVALAAAANRLAVLWAPDGITGGSVGSIVQRRSIDAGTTFAPVETLASDAAVVVGARPAAVAVFSAWILVAYERSDGRQVLLRSADAGASFTTQLPTPLPTTSSSSILWDVFVGYGGAARIVYIVYAGSDQPDRLLMRTSVDYGAHWTTAQTVAGPSPEHKNFANVVAHGRTIVVFDRYLSSYGGVYARSGS